MQSSIKEQNGLMLKIEFLVPADEVDKCFLKHYRKIQQKTKVSGFRAGKIPLSQIRNHYYNEVSSDVRDDLFRLFYPKVLEELKIHPASNPVMIDLDLKEGADGYFLLELESHPKVKLKNYMHLEVKQPDTNITEKEIDQTLENLRQSQTTLKDSENKGPIKAGDFVIINLTIPKEAINENSQELKNNDFLVEVTDDPNKTDKNFNQTLLGMRVGEQKACKCLLPKELFKSIRWKSKRPVQIEVYVKCLKEQVIPELNNELAKKFKFDTLDQLKTQVRKDLETNLKQKHREEMEDTVVKQMVENNPVELPLRLVEQHKQDLRKNAEEYLKKRKMSVEEQENFLRDREYEFEQKARENLQANYLIVQLIKLKGIKVEKEETQHILKKFFPQKKPEEMQIQLEKEDRWDNFIYNLIRQKAISYLLENAKIIK